jgi:hypothetical protein
MFEQRLESLPQTEVRRILIFRTAPTPQIQWVVERLKDEYPGAEFWILGRQLDHPLFADMHKLQIAEPWLNPRSYRPFRTEAEEAGFDLAVMVLNSDSWAGYESVSRVMKQVTAREKLVAGYTKEWFAWRHDLFQEGSGVLRFAMAALEFLLLPLVFVLVAATPAGSKYMPSGQGRPSPGYDR